MLVIVSVVQSKEHAKAPMAMMDGRRVKRLLLRVLIGSVLALLALGLFYSYLFGPTDKFAQVQEFIVEEGETYGDVVKELKEKNLIRDEGAFRLAYLRYAKGRDVRAGGYKISGAMDTWSIAESLARPPFFVWITIKPGERKEQIAEKLVRELNWSDAEVSEWLGTSTVLAPSYTEGVYFPDTYLIPSDYTPGEVAERFRSRFKQEFAEYAARAGEKDMLWTDVLTLASLVEREASRTDKALVAGILWNRIHEGMPLAVDATLQYVKGNKEIGWWPVPKSEDKFLESPFNTYLNTGLPPHPIANPSTASIEAVIDYEETDCLFYIHDNDGVIHCSPSYAGHLANIDRYLR